MYLSMVKSYRSEAERLNYEVDNHDGEVYLFGASIFSQFLFHSGLDEKNIVGIVDNSMTKQGKRLYGTSLSVTSLDIVAKKAGAAVVVKAGQYQEEIEKQLIKINKNIRIIT